MRLAHLVVLSSTLAVSMLAAEMPSRVMVPESEAGFKPEAAEKFEGKPQLELIPQAPGARTGKVYLRKNAQGLLIVGTVIGGPPQFARTPAEIMEKEHIEVWLAVTPNPVLPEIGWGNQFGDVELPNGEASCDDIAKSDTPGNKDLEKCPEFVRKQKSYRAYFTRLFVRQWQVAPGVAVESFATPAYDAIEQQFGPSKNDVYRLPQLLKPSGAPQAVFKSHSQPDGYDFEVLVPWKAFPPSDKETLKDVSVLIEAYSPAAPGKKVGPYATSAPGRHYGDAATFNQIRFEREREYELTPCDYELVGLDINDQPTKALFFPAKSDLISDVFILENYKGGYAYAPTGLSPGTRTTHFFWKKLGEDEYVCGPILRYKKNEQVKDLELTEHEYTQQIVVEDENMAVRRLPEGALLIKDGPQEAWSKYGSGQCGACPRGRVEVYALSPNLDVKRAFSVEDVVGNQITDMDVQFSPDWSRIGVYRFMTDWIPGREPKPPEWRDQFYCLRADMYEECAPQAHDAPPEPRTLKFESEY